MSKTYNNKDGGKVLPTPAPYKYGAVIYRAKGEEGE